MDSVADALIRIKNGYLASRKEVLVSYSKLILAILKVLQEEGYIEKVEVIKSLDNKNITLIKVPLKYEGDSLAKKKPAMTEVKRISKPGLRVYKNSRSLPFVLNGLGIAIISTPKGVMTDRKARKEGVGGELLAYVW